MSEAEIAGESNGAWRNRIVGHGEEAPDQLLAHPENFRVHTALQSRLTNDALAGVGWVDEVMVNRRTGRVVNGHLRIVLAMREDQPLVPVRYVDLTEEEERVVLRTFDPLGEMAEIDREKLEDLHAQVLQTAKDPRLLAMLDELWAASPLGLADARVNRINNPGEDDNPEGGDMSAAAESPVRVVQLFMTVDELTTFRQLISDLQTAWQCEETHQIILTALTKAHEAIEVAPDRPADT